MTDEERAAYSRALQLEANAALRRGECIIWTHWRDGRLEVRCAPLYRKPPPEPAERPSRRGVQGALL